MNTISDKLLQLNEIKMDTFATTKEHGLDTSGRTFSNIHELWSQIKKANYQTKNAIPSDVAVEVVADEGYDALAKVLVEAAANLQPHNIRKGITIFGKVGTMDVEAATELPDDFKSEDPRNPDPGTIEDAQKNYELLTGTPAPTDYMILQSDSGDITFGFLDTDTEATELYNYNGRVLSEFDGGVRYNQATYDRNIIIYDEALDTYYGYAFHSSTGFTHYRELVYSSSTTYHNLLRSGKTIYYYYTYDEESGWTRHERVGTAGLSTSEAYLSYERHDGYSRKLIWSEMDLPAYGVTTATPTPVLAGGFEITAYNAITTEFCAKGWRRLSYHKATNSWTLDDFTDTPSTGWNYLKHLIFTTRSALYYKYKEVWPRRVGRVDIPTDMSSWSKNPPGESAFTSVTYDVATGKNICAYTGVGDHELIGTQVSLRYGKTYTLKIQYYTPSTITGMYAEPYAPYFGFFPTTCLENGNAPYDFAFAATALPVGTMYFEHTYTCTYTPPRDMDAIIGFSAGSTEDGVPVEFHISGITLVEQVESLLLDAKPLMVAGSLRIDASDGYVGSVANRLRVGLTEERIELEPGTTVRVAVKAASTPQWAMWFILSSGVAKIAAGENLVLGTDYIDTGWMYSGQTYVVPEDTQYVWLNFHYTGNGNVSLDALTRYDIYKVP